MLAASIRIVALFALATVLAGIPTGPAHAQNSGAYVLQDPINARATSMGYTGTADNSDLANVWFNPANALMSFGVYAEYDTWKTNPIEDLELPYTRWAAGGSFAVSDQTDLGIVATFGELDYGTTFATGSQGNTIGSGESWERYLSLAVASSVPLGERAQLRIGVAGTRYWAQYAGGSFTQSFIQLELDGFAFDVGTTVAVPCNFSGWQVTPAVGFAYVNVGSDIDLGNGWSDPFPTRLQFGASVRMDGPEVSLFSAQVPVVSFVQNVDAVDRLHGDTSGWGMGTEFAVMQMLFLRAGVQEERQPYYYGYDNDGDEAAWSIGLGVPVGPVHTRFDYARLAGYNQPHYGFAVTWEF
jgi:hypothetical protein